MRNRIPIPGSPLVNGEIQYQRPDGHARIVRTGNTRLPRVAMRGPDILDTEWEFECECSLVGWTCSTSILGHPIEPI